MVYSKNFFFLVLECSLVILGFDITRWGKGEILHLVWRLCYCLSSIHCCFVYVHFVYLFIVIAAMRLPLATCLLCLLAGYTSLAQHVTVNVEREFTVLVCVGVIFFFLRRKNQSSISCCGLLLLFFSCCEFCRLFVWLWSIVSVYGWPNNWPHKSQVAKAFSFAFWSAQQMVKGAWIFLFVYNCWFWLSFFLVPK